jgi:DNA-binding transcriptional ArsR family regulator
MRPTPVRRNAGEAHRAAAERRGKIWRLLARTPEGLTVQEIAEALRVARSHVYADLTKGMGGVGRGRLGAWIATGTRYRSRLYYQRLL